MKTKSILMIAPDYPPAKGGVSDYSYLFVSELKKICHVDVLTSERFKSWKGLGLTKALWHIGQSECDTLLIQYTPYLYGKRGINFQFPLLIFLYSLFKKKKIQLMVHEYNYPNLGDLKSFILYLCHHLMGRLLVLASDTVFTSTEYLKKLIEPLSLAPVVHLPVGSNILKTSEESLEILERLEVKSGEYLCLFGGFHPSKRWDVLIESLKDSALRIVHIGATKEDYSRAQLEPNSTWVLTGHLEPREVSLLFSHARGNLHYFVNGATTRRGSLMVAIEHQTPVLVNRGKYTEKTLADCPNITLSESEEDFKKLASELFGGERPEYQFDNPFSWSKIVSNYLTY